VINDKRLLCLHCSAASVTLLNEALAVVSDTASGCEGTISFAAATLNKEYQLAREYQLPANAERESSVCPPSPPVKMGILRMGISDRMCPLGAVVLDAAATGVVGGVTLIAFSDSSHFKLVAMATLEATSLRFTGGDVSKIYFVDRAQTETRVTGPGSYSGL
jgi:hypothetical protein